jgi:hypothetical protein
MCLIVFAPLVYDIQYDQLRSEPMDRSISLDVILNFSLGLIPRAPDLCVSAGHLRGCWTW